KVFASSQSTLVRFERINTIERQQLTMKSKEVHALGDQRSAWESPTHKPSPAPPSPRQPDRVEPKPVTASAPGQPTISRAPVKESPVTRSAPRPDVRVAQPEREVVANPPIVPRPSESRYIAKESPSHPNQETYHTGQPPNPKSPNSPGKVQGDANPGKNREK